MYNEILLKKILKIHLINNDLKDFICGEGVSIIHSDPHDINSPHSFYTSQTIINKYYKENPQSNIDKIYIETIMDILNNDYGNQYIYDVFKSLVVQLYLENSGKATFVIDKNLLIDILKKLKDKINFYSEILKQSKYNEGADYENGVYEFLEKESQRVYEETGIKIL